MHRDDDSPPGNMRGAHVAEPRWSEYADFSLRRIFPNVFNELRVKGACRMLACKDGWKLWWEKNKEKYKKNAPK